MELQFSFLFIKIIIKWGEGGGEGLSSSRHDKPREKYRRSTPIVESVQLPYNCVYERIYSTQAATPAAHHVYHRLRLLLLPPLPPLLLSCTVA